MNEGVSLFDHLTWSNEIHSSKCLGFSRSLKFAILGSLKSYEISMINNDSSVINWYYILNITNPYNRSQNIILPSVGLNEQLVVIVTARSLYNETLSAVFAIVGSVPSDTYLAVRFILTVFKLLVFDKMFGVGGLKSSDSR